MSGISCILLDEATGWRTSDFIAKVSGMLKRGVRYCFLTMVVERSMFTSMKPFLYQHELHRGASPTLDSNHTISHTIMPAPALP